MALTLCFIHGAGASSRSFNYLAGSLTQASLFIDHAPGERVSAIIDRASQAIAAIEGQVIVIGHSLGGLVAAGLAHLDNVAGLVTLSAPFGGHALSGWMSLFSAEPLFRDTTPMGSTIATIWRGYARHRKQHLAVVSTEGGLPSMMQANDGVLTVSSQMAWVGPSYQKLKLNHFEVLLAPEVAGMVAAWIAALPVEP